MASESTAFRMVKKHSKRADWHEWWVPGELVYRGNTGRKLPFSWVSWFVLRCNNPHCPGEAIVSESWLASQIPLGIGDTDAV